MKTSTALKLKNAGDRTNSPERRRAEIARKAAAVSRQWSTDERRQRTELAEHMQRRLFATIAGAGVQLQSVA